VKGILVALDCTEEVVDEAIRLSANLIVAHHPILFKGIKSITGKNYVERTLLKAIRNDVALYAIHTNLDNVHTGVNRKLAQRLELRDLKVLHPRTDTLVKLVTFVPAESTEQVADALHQAGAGEIGDYKNCSFRVEGTGTFLPTADANPAVGERGKLERVGETRLEVIFESYKTAAIVAALRSSHPYEEVAHYLSTLVNENQEVGSGMIGVLPKPLDSGAFLEMLAERLNLKVVRHTRPVGGLIERVAVCGGAGSFLLSRAVQAGAQAFVSADFKYHEFFDADGRILIADVGHYESEVYTKELLKELLLEKFPTFAINFSRTVTNPISYFIK
jgi:dinuclear metal center YbgI/SA1388 family protein